MKLNIMDIKLIEAWTVMTCTKEDMDKPIQQMMDEAGVPQKYREQVEIKVAERRIRELPQTS